MSNLFQYDTTGDMATMGGQISPTINVEPNMQAAKAFQGLSNVLQNYGNMVIKENEIETAEAKRQKALRDAEIEKAATADYLEVSTSVAQAKSQLNMDLESAKTPDEMDLAYSFFNETLGFEIQDRRPEALEKVAKEVNNTFLKGQEAYQTTMLKFSEGEQKALQVEEHVNAVASLSAFKSNFDLDIAKAGNDKKKVLELIAKHNSGLNNLLKQQSPETQKALAGQFATEKEAAIKKGIELTGKINKQEFGNMLTVGAGAVAGMDMPTLSEYYKISQDTARVLNIPQDEASQKFFETGVNTSINNVDVEAMVNNRDYGVTTNLKNVIDTMLKVDPKLKNKTFVLEAYQKVAKLKNDIDSSVKADIKQGSTDFYLPQEEFNSMLEKGLTNGAINTTEAQAMANDRISHMTTSPVAVTHRAEIMVNTVTGSGQAFNLKALAGRPEQAPATKLVQQQINESLITGNYVLISENLKTNTAITVPLVEAHMKTINKELINATLMKVKPEQEEEKAQRVSALLQQKQELAFHSNKHISEEQRIENQVAIEIAKGTISDPEKFLVSMKNSKVPLKSMSDSNVQKLYEKLPFSQQSPARTRYSVLTAAGMDESAAYDIVIEAYSLKEVGDSNILGNGNFRTSLGDFDPDNLPVWVETFKGVVPIDYEEQIEEFEAGKNPQIVLNNNLLEFYTDDGTYLAVPINDAKMARITAEANIQVAINARENASGLGVLAQDAITGGASFFAEKVQELKDLTDWVQETPFGHELDAAGDAAIYHSPLGYLYKMGAVATEVPTLLDGYVKDVYVNKLSPEEALDNLAKNFKKTLNKLPKAPHIFRETDEQKLETQQGAKRAVERRRKALETASQVNSQAREGSPVLDFLKEKVGSVLDYIIPEAEASDKPTGETISPMKTTGSKENPFKNPSEMRKAKKVLYGKDAIKKVEQMEGRQLSYSEKRVVEEEAFVDGYYLDTENVLTYGVGQTRGYIEAGFKKSFEAHKKETQRIIKNFDTLPEYLQAELIQATYRGDIATGKKKDGTLLGSPTTQKLINNGEFEKAAKSFLDNNDYRKSKKDKTGIYERMEKVAAALLKYSKELKNK